MQQFALLFNAASSVVYKQVRASMYARCLVPLGKRNQTAWLLNMLLVVG